MDALPQTDKYRGKTVDKEAYRLRTFLGAIGGIRAVRLLCGETHSSPGGSLQKRRSMRGSSRGHWPRGSEHRGCRIKQFCRIQYDAGGSSTRDQHFAILKQRRGMERTSG